MLQIRGQRRRPREVIEALYSDQGVFVCCVDVIAIVLYQTGQAAEFGYISAQDVEFVHGAKGGANADGCAEEVEKDATGSLRRPEGVVDEMDVVFNSLFWPLH